MKPNELRIGNWVSHKDYSTEMFKVKDIYCNCGEDYYVVNTIGGKNGEWLNHIDLILPIPLTEELLLKCGFELRIDSPLRTSYTRYEQYLEYTFPKTNTTYTYKLGLLFGNRHFDILYLHQLQNLFYAITGEELEIKL